MNKTELTAAIAEKAELSKKDAEAAVNAFVASIGETLAAGDTVSLPGFGTFKTSDRAAREGRNPQTGEAIQIKASKAVSFKVGKTLKDLVN